MQMTFKTKSGAAVEITNDFQASVVGSAVKTQEGNRFSAEIVNGVYSVVFFYNHKRIVAQVSEEFVSQVKCFVDASINMISSQMSSAEKFSEDMHRRMYGRNSDC